MARTFLVLLAFLGGCSEPDLPKAERVCKVRNAYLYRWTDPSTGYIVYRCGDSLSVVKP
jgi:hypothetical protein